MLVMKCSRLLRLGSRPSVKLLKAVIGNVFLCVETVTSQGSEPNRSDLSPGETSVQVGLTNSRPTDISQLGPATLAA